MLSLVIPIIVLIPIFYTIYKYKVIDPKKLKIEFDNIIPGKTLYMECVRNINGPGLICVAYEVLEKYMNQHNTYYIRLREFGRKCKGSWYDLEGYKMSHLQEVEFSTSEPAGDVKKLYLYNSKIYEGEEVEEDVVVEGELETEIHYKLFDYDKYPSFIMIKSDECEGYFYPKG